MQRTFVVGSEKKKPKKQPFVECRENISLLRKTLREYNQAGSIVEAAGLRAECTDQRKQVHDYTEREEGRR